MSTPKRKRATRRRTEESVSLKTVLKSTLFALPVAALVGLLLSRVVTAVLLKTKNPTAPSTVAGRILFYITAAVLGAVTVRIHKRRAPFFCGLVGGVLLLSLQIACFLALQGTGAGSTALSLLLCVLILPVTLLGALLAAREKKQKRRRH